MKEFWWEGRVPGTDSGVPLTDERFHGIELVIDGLVAMGEESKDLGKK